jgi:hypothetical protein
MADDPQIQGLAKTIARLLFVNEAQFDEQRAELKEAKKQTTQLERTANKISKSNEKQIKELEKKLKDAEAAKAETVMQKIQKAFGLGGLGVDEAITKSGNRIKKGELGFEAALNAYNKRIQDASDNSAKAYSKVGEDLAKSNKEVAEGFKTAFSNVGDDFSELFGSAMGSQLKDAGKKVKAAINIPLKLLAGLWPAFKGLGGVLKNTGLRLKRFGLGLKNMFTGGILGKLKLALFIGAGILGFIAIRKFMKSGFGEGIQLMIHAFVQGFDRLRIAFLEAFGKQGKADEIRKKTIAREIDEQKRLGNISEDATGKNLYTQALANSEVRDYMGDAETFNMSSDFLGKEAGLSKEDVGGIRTDASEGAIDIYGALKKKEVAVDYDSREMTLIQKSDYATGMQEQYNVKIGYLNADGKPTTAEELAAELNMNLAEVVTFVQANPDLTMGEDSKIYKKGDFLIKKQEDGNFAFQGEAGFLNSMYENTASFFGSDSDQSERLPIVGAPDVKSTIDTQYSLLDEEQQAQLSNRISPQGISDNARYEKLRRNDPEFLEAVKDEYGINAHFMRKDANVDQFGMVGDVPVTKLLMLNEEYLREMKLYRTQLDDFMTQGQVKDYGNSNINTIMNQGGNVTNITSGTPTAQDVNNFFIPTYDNGVPKY